MRKVILLLNVSLDGIADHTVTIADDELHTFATKLINHLDAILFGRTTYQLFQDFWPTATENPELPESMLAFAQKINTIPKIVFSRTLSEVNWNNTRLVKRYMVEEVLRMKRQPGSDIGIFGSLNTATMLINQGLVDDFWLLVHPVILGKGERMFDGLHNKHNLKLADTQTFNSGVVVLHYQTVQNKIIKTQTR